ncbi:MAG: twin-arginine translocase TatA/TatE family subunit [Flavobacteriia bacterium]|nr:twin-arginine translocase TatA/TatE family subunit [Flavobacteriia bacterium]
MMSISLFLNDVSGSEIIVVMLVILLFFGSKSIPSIAKTMGKALYQIRNATAEIQNEIKSSSSEITKDINLSNILTAKQEELLAPMDQVYTDIENTVHYSGNMDKKTSINTVETPEATNKEINSNQNNFINNDSSSDNNG